MLVAAVRLQFEEIELGIDLEAAIDDYLAERRQARQSQHQQVLMSSNGEPISYDEDDETIQLNPAEAWNANSPNLKQEQGLIDSSEERQEVNEQEIGADHEGDEFVEAISQVHTNESHKLLALGASSGMADSLLTGDDMMMMMVGERESRQVVPLIECQLLVGRYKYMSELLANELEPLACDTRISFEGLVFLSDFVGHEQLDPTHWELITELASRSREFQSMLSNSLKRLEMARERLRQSNELRSRALSRLTLEFHLLMGELANRLLDHEVHQTIDDGVDDINEQVNNLRSHDERRNVQARRIVQLDSIQETADWARELEMRFTFLEAEHSLLARERHLLTQAKLTSSRLDQSEKLLREEEDAIKMEEEADKGRVSILDCRRPLVGALSNLWSLIEDYETQQVKWLNSDTKRIDFNIMDSTYRMFCQRLELLRKSSLACIRSSSNFGNQFCLELFELNIDELEQRLEEFAKRRLPLFKFLTNKYLTDAHWKRVSEILESSVGSETRTTGGVSTERRIFAPATIAPQSCTTLAQFLELEADRHVDQLDELNREAIIEQELTDFLLIEASSHQNWTSEKRAHLKALNLSGAWFAGWTDKQLVMAASRFIEAKMAQNGGPDVSVAECQELATKLVVGHSTIRRYLKLLYELNLDCLLLSKLANKKDKSITIQPNKPLTLRTCRQLTSAELVTPSLFVEFLRLFTSKWLEDRTKLAQKCNQLELDLQVMDKHQSDIQLLVDRVSEIRETDLRVATSEGEALLVELERETVRLEIEREILATKESLALERQREALGRRDDCIRQITERAIPAIRAATKALDCLDAKSLRTLRYVRPHPPDQVRLVLEAVCLLGSCTVTSGELNTPPKPMEPERRFDALKGTIYEDYWNPACRMLNGTHSSQFIKDLRRVHKRTLPRQVMRLIRRRYLSSSAFRLRNIERVSPECALLAKWLIAVDVFDRVINVVRPEYGQYLESERQLATLLQEVSNKQREINSIGVELQRLEESFERRMGHKMSLTDCLDQCSEQLEQVEETRKELIDKRSSCEVQLKKVKQLRSRLANRCLLRAVKKVYLEAMRHEECKSMTNILRHHFRYTSNCT